MKQKIRKKQESSGIQRSYNYYVVAL